MRNLLFALMWERVLAAAVIRQAVADLHVGPLRRQEEARELLRAAARDLPPLVRVRGRGSRMAGGSDD